MLLRITDDADPVSRYLPEQGFDNGCQINDIYSAPRRFGNVRDKLYLLVSSHGCVAQNCYIYVTVSSGRATGHRAENVSQFDVGVLAPSGLNLSDRHANLPRYRAGELAVLMPMKLPPVSTNL